MATTIIVICPRQIIEPQLKALDLPADWQFTFREAIELKACLHHELSLIFIDNMAAYNSMLEQVRELYTRAPFQVYVILGAEIQADLECTELPATGIWTWPLDGPLFRAKISTALNLSVKCAEMSRHMSILSNQKQLFLRQKARLEYIITSVPFGIIMVDTENRILLMNREAKKTIGVDLNDDIQTSDYLREKIAYYPFDLVRGMKDKDGIILEEELNLPSGRFLAKIVLVKDYSQGILGTLIIFFPLGDAESVRDHAIELIDTAFHEIKTPVTSIITSIDIITKEIYDQLNNRQQRIMTLASQNCTRLMQLSKDYLNVSRIESGRLELDIQELDLEQFLTETVDSFTVSASEKNIILASQFNCPVKSVRADPAQLRQVFNNLLSNAIKFSNTGQTITISTESYPVKQDMVRIGVHNVGPPIPVEDQQKIFERFYRSNSSRHLDRIGSGLGLHITRTIVNSLGGHIWVESSPAHGTTFSFTLPGVIIEN
ncbi:PAS domain-containing protein [bacterium]|nr:PAS domain-containing protein [bacterium]